MINRIILVMEWARQETDGGKEKEIRFNHVLDAYGLFLVIHAIREWEEMTWREHADDLTCLFSEFFPGEFSMEYFQKIADLIKDDFNPLSDHPELTCLGDFPLQMAYVHKDQEALLVLGQEPVCFMLLTKAAAGGNFWKRFRSRRAWLFMWDFRNGRAWLFIWDFRNKPARQENEKAGRGADDEKK